MKKALHFVAVSTFLTTAAIPVFAHHAFSPDFDWAKPITLKGTVAKVDWVAPHALVHIDVKHNGVAANWVVELGSPKMLAKFGWSEDALKAGDEVTVEGWLAKDGRKFMSAKSFTLPDGSWLFAASSFFDMPYRASKGKIGACISDETCIQMGREITQR